MSKLLTVLKDPETGHELNAVLTGVNFRLTDPKNIAELKRLGVKKVFTLFPTEPRHIETRAKREFEIDPKNPVALEKIYQRFGIPLDFVAVLRSHGIHVTSLARNPQSIQYYESFGREAKQISGKFLIQCIHGRHASTSYALYHLATTTNLPLERIHRIMNSSGISPHDVSRAEEFLADANINLRRLVEDKALQTEAKLRQTAAITKSMKRQLKKKQLGKGKAIESFLAQERRTRGRHGNFGHGFGKH